MDLIINGWLVKVTNFTPSKNDNSYYNVEVKAYNFPVTMRFNHTQFYRENPQRVMELHMLYGETTIKKIKGNI